MHVLYMGRTVYIRIPVFIWLNAYISHSQYPKKKVVVALFCVVVWWRYMLLNELCWDRVHERGMNFGIDWCSD